MPIRLRLTLWYGLLLGITLLLFCVGLYLALQAALERNFDQMLRLRASQVERSLSGDAAGDQELSPSEITASDLEPAHPRPPRTSGAASRSPTRCPAA